VEDAADSGDRALDTRNIEHVAAHHLDVEAREVIRWLARKGEHANGNAAFEKFSDDGTPQKAGAAGD
jgi:hypothetical protein